MTTVDRRSALLGLATSPLFASVAPAQVKPPAPKPKEIRLDMAYTWTGQKGIKPLDLDQPAMSVNAMYKQLLSHGLSNVVLVRGSDIGDAVALTQVAFRSGVGTGVLTRPNDNNPSNLLWIVAYVGRDSSSPLHYEFLRVEQTGNRFRVEYRDNRPDGGSDEYIPYAIWVPVGELEAGKYTLELYEAKAKDVVLSRLIRYAK